MEYRKHVEYAFFAVLTGIISFVASHIGKMSENIEAMRLSMQELNGRIEVLSERNTNADLAIKDHEQRLRSLERGHRRAAASGG